MFRQDRFQFVEEIISKINPDKLSKNRRTIFFKLKADWLHHQENFDGAFEAYELRDNNTGYHGKSVMKAVNNVNSEIFDSITGFDVSNQIKIDENK